MRHFTPALALLLIVACSSAGNSDEGNGAAGADAGGAPSAAGAAPVSSGGSVSGAPSSGGAPSAGAGNSASGMPGAPSGGAGGSVGGSGSGGAPAGGAPNAGATCPKPANQLCHELYANDNSRNELHYVNEFDPSKSWTIKVDAGPRGIQLVDNAKAKKGKAVLISVDKGFAEYDVVDGALLNRVNAFGSVTSALRVASDTKTQLPPGTTVLARDSTPSELDFVDAAGKAVAPAVKLQFAGGTEIRKLERDPTTGNLSFTKYESTTAAYIYEVTEQGEPVAKLKLPAGSKGYNALFRSPEAGGGLIAASGSPCTVLTLDAKGNVLSTLGGKDKFKDASGKLIFTDVFSGVQQLPNGNLVIANWLGHVDPKQHADTPEVLEISPTNELVWSWGNQTLATYITYAYVVR